MIFRNKEAKSLKNTRKDVLFLSETTPQAQETHLNYHPQCL